MFPPPYIAKNFHVRLQNREYGSISAEAVNAVSRSTVDLKHLQTKQRIVCLESLKCPPEWGYCTGAAFVHDNHNMVVMKMATGFMASASVNRTGRSRVLKSQFFPYVNCRDSNLQTLPTNCHRLLSFCLGCASSLNPNQNKHRARIWNVTAGGQCEEMAAINNMTLAQAANVHENLLLGCTNVKHFVNKYCILDYVTGKEIVNFGNIPTGIDWPGLPAWNPMDTTVALLGSMWDVRSGQAVQELVSVDSMMAPRDFTEYAVYDAKIGDCHFFHPDGTVVLVGEKIFDIRTGKLLFSCPAFADAFVQFTESGSMVYAFDMVEPASLLVYSAKDFSLLHTFNDVPLHLAVVDKHDHRILAQPSNVKSPIILGYWSVDNPAPPSQPTSGNSSLRCHWSFMPTNLTYEPDSNRALDVSGNEENEPLSSEDEEDETNLSIHYEQMSDDENSATESTLHESDWEDEMDTSSE